MKYVTKDKTICWSDRIFFTPTRMFREIEPPTREPFPLIIGHLLNSFSRERFLNRRKTFLYTWEVLSPLVVEIEATNAEAHREYWEKCILVNIQPKDENRLKAPEFFLLLFDISFPRGRSVPLETGNLHQCGYALLELIWCASEIVRVIGRILYLVTKYFSLRLHVHCQSVF